MAQIDDLNKKYKKLLEQSFKLSNKNRRASDEKYSEAQAVLAEIEKLKSEG